MGSLETSLENFFDALGALERAVDSRLASDTDRPDASALADELEGLRAERVNLKAELDRLGSENKSLEALTDDVNLRLDGAIEEIRSVLE
jgi:SMC interacting uncharacterized protein involved in chromosome segregation